MPEKYKPLPEPSEEFKLAVRHAGSISVDCELCGRIHFGNDENALEESYGKGYYQKLLRNNKKDPDKYVYHADEDMVPWGRIDGKQAVIDCKCNQLSKYEKFLWNHRHLIANYFEARAKKMIEHAKSNKDLSNKLKNVVGSIK